MTPLQLKLLEFVRDRIGQTGLPPTYDELADHAGHRGKSSVHRAIDALVRDGELVRLPKAGARNLRLPMPSLIAVPTAVLQAEIDRRAKADG